SPVALRPNLRRNAIRPRMGLLELRGEAEQRRLVCRATDEVDTDRQAVDDTEGHHRSGLAGDVDDRRERRELAPAPELVPWIVRLEHPSDRHRELPQAG